MPIREENLATLKEHKAIELRYSGMTSWNAWVDNNEVANVDISDVDFETPKVANNLEDISFLTIEFRRAMSIFAGPILGKENG